MAAKKPDIQALKAAKDEKKLIKALNFKSDASVREEAACALGAFCGVTALKPLISSIENEKEQMEVRSAACSAVGDICSRVISEHSSNAADSIPKSDQRKQKKEKEAVESARDALKKQMDNGPQDLSIAAARAFMSLPMTDTSIFEGSVSESAFSFSALEPVAETVPAEPSAADNESPHEDPPAEEKDNADEVPDSEVETASSDEDHPAEEQLPADSPEPSASVQTHTVDPDLSEPVEIAPDTYWVGRREGTALERNIYLRIFRKDDKVLNMLIDPGPPEDLTSLAEKLSGLIGGIRNLHVMFLNHQDPDVSFNSVHIQKLNPNCIVLCSEDSWRLVRFYGLDEKKYKPVESFKHLKTELNTGHTISFIPTPFCHFRGACMLYDHETGVLFSGDFLGGLSSKRDLYASQDSWDGISAFHQIYMPSQMALRNAVSNVRGLQHTPAVIAPQHGSIITGAFVEDFLSRIDNLEVGLDLFLKEHSRQNSIAALNDLLTELGQLLDPSIIPDTLSAFRTDGSFPEVIASVENGVTDIKADGHYAVELFLKELREKIPADKLDLFDVSVVKVLSSWEIPLPAFFQSKDRQKSIFSN